MTSHDALRLSESLMRRQILHLMPGELVNSDVGHKFNSPPWVISNNKPGPPTTLNKVYVRPIYGYLGSIERCRRSCRKKYSKHIQILV